MVLEVGGKAVKAYKATVDGPKQMYGQLWWKAKLAPQADFPNGLNEWLTRCGDEAGTAHNPGPPGFGRGFGPAYYAETGELPPWCPYSEPNPELSFGAGAPVDVASSSVFVDEPPIQANGQTRVRVRRANVSVGACFPKFDPLEMYGVGRPPAQVLNPAPAMAAHQTPYQLPGMNPATGLPRLRRSAWGQRTARPSAAPTRVAPPRPRSDPGGVSWRCYNGVCRGTDADNLKTGDCVQGTRKGVPVCCCSTVFI